MSFTIENEVLERYYEETGTKEVIIPDGVKVISQSAFKTRIVEKSTGDRAFHE